jgi:hypothetical protein
MGLSKQVVDWAKKSMHFLVAQAVLFTLAAFIGLNNLSILHTTYRTGMYSTVEVVEQ